MAKKRSKKSTLTVSRLLQECNTTCAFCSERNVETFEYHHIDEDPSNDELENLIVACSSCHTRITRGSISMADVVTRKRELVWIMTKQEEASKVSPQTVGVSVTLNDSVFKGDIAQNMTKISTPRAPKVIHPLGSIGANLSMKAYIDYLLTRYYTFRKADKSYGAERKFSLSVIHKEIERDFGSKTFFLPEHRFEALAAHLKAHIDTTALGRNNHKKEVRNYHPFEEHCQKFKLTPT